MVASEHRTDWVQPILVDKAGTHADTVTAAAVASVLRFAHAQATEQEAWSTWLSGPFTKTVRRVETSKLEALAREHSGVLVHLGPSRAAAFAPVHYAELPKAMSRLQVSGTDFPKVPDVVALNGDVRRPVRILVSDQLTTGKAAAQAAHALFAWVLQATEPDKQAWLEDAMATPVVFVDPTELARVAATDPFAVPIRDSGLTEVDPGTLTAVAVPAPDPDRVETVFAADQSRSAASLPDLTDGPVL